MKYTNLLDLFILKIQALYDIESEITKALPKLAKSATDPELETAFSEHLQETEMQRERLEQVFEMLDAKPKKAKSAAIRGLADDGAWLMKQEMPGELMDVSLISSARYVEHYEMAGYMSAIALAKQLGYDDMAALLEQTLEEEEAADEKMTTLGEKIMKTPSIQGDNTEEGETE